MNCMNCNTKEKFWDIKKIYHNNGKPKLVLCNYCWGLILNLAWKELQKRKKEII